MYRNRSFIVVAILFVSLQIKGQTNHAKQNKDSQEYKEPYRPQFHFSPKAHWINDPNGLVYINGIYHLFFQYYPDSTVWGPMHWGHAVSRDLIHWKEQSIALFPDSLGYIFSGSAVVDKNNTTGFGKKGKIPIVAIFTHHDPVKEKAHRNDFQNQSLAYSLDEGKTWIKYSRNPVLKNPGVTDFRDPKVMWYEPGKKWIMTLATKDRISFYSALDLKNWKKESEFGMDIGAHGGVWECPDLFYFDDKGKKIWILIVNINPGGPNKGSATQYFTGTFNGHEFNSADTKTRWLDYGPDEYAGVTWSNTGSRRIFLGWMSNWLYANVVPTKSWRNAMTIPRELNLRHVGNEILVASEPVKEINIIQRSAFNLNDFIINKEMDLSSRMKGLPIPGRIDLSFDNLPEFALVIFNDLNEKVRIGYDKGNNQYYIDRTMSGSIEFQKDFSGKHYVPRFSRSESAKITILIDVSSVELFADNGLSVMTEIFFPGKPFNKAKIVSTENAKVNKLSVNTLKSIWNDSNRTGSKIKIK